MRHTNWLSENRRWVWVAAIVAVMVFGCALLAIGGGWWLGHQAAQKADERLSTGIDLPATATAPDIVLSTRVLPTDTPAPTATPQPTATPTATPGPSLGDRLLLPTATPTPIPEGVIVFLSSRDLDSEEDLRLYVIETDGKNPVPVSDPVWKRGDFLISLGQKETVAVIRQQITFNVNFSDGSFSSEARTSQAVFNVVSRKRSNVGRLSFSSGGMQINPIDLDWASDGSMVFAGFENLSIYYLPGSQSNLQQLTFHPVNYEFLGDKVPVFSPDGQWIAFARDVDDIEADGIWVMRTNGSEAHLVISSSEIQVDGINDISWSPDGNYFAFQARKNDENGVANYDLWVSDSEGNKPTRLIIGTKNRSVVNKPLWLQDNQRIVFGIENIDTDTVNLFVINATGGKPKQLTFEGDYNGSPIWLPISMDEILANAPTPAPPTPTPKPAAVPPPPAPSSCPSPGAQITSPRPGTRFTRRYNHILGTANINRFSRWKLEYSTNPNGGWQYLFERNYPVINGELMMFDASTVPRGPYGLRLTVVDETGNYPEPCVVWFTNGY